MTFDIDNAMNERFAKGHGFVDTDEGKADAAAKTKEANDMSGGQGQGSKAPAEKTEVTEKADTEKVERSEKTEEVKRSFDIGSRMAQWDAAGRSQHVEDTETILRGGNPYVEEKRGREDFKDPENIFQFMEWAFGPFDYGQDEGYLRLKSALKNNPELARSLMAAIEQATIQNGDYRDDSGYRMPPSEYQNPEDGMNRIGADKPRQEAWEEFSYTYPEPDGEGGYYSREETIADDVTEEKPGPTSRAKAAAKEAKEAKESKDDAEGDFEGE